MTTSRMISFTWNQQQDGWNVDNNDKHTSKLVLEQIKQASTNFLEWPSQSTDLNPTENL